MYRMGKENSYNMANGLNIPIKRQTINHKNINIYFGFHLKFKP